MWMTSNAASGAEPKRGTRSISESRARIRRGHRHLAAHAILLAVACLVQLTARAQGEVPAHSVAGTDQNALPGVHEVPLAAALPEAIAARIGLGYGWTESVLSTNDRHHRLQLDAAASFSPSRNFGGSLRVLGRYDAHRGEPSGADSGIVTETHLAARAAFPLSEQLHAGAELGLWLPAGDSVGDALSALSGDLSLLAAYTPLPELTLGLSLGMRMDRSRHAGGDPLRYSAADRFALGVSDAMWAARPGLAVSYRIGALECVLEWAYRMYFAHPAESPHWIRAGARYRPRGPLQLELLVGVSPSARPSLAEGAPLAVVEPRLSVGLSATYAWSLAAAPPPLKLAPTAPVAPAAPLLAAVRGQVLAKSGAPLAAASVNLVHGEARSSTVTDEQGAFALRELPAGSYELEVSAEGFTARRQSLSLQAGATEELRLELEPELPIGQIRGSVRRFDGRPIAANIALRELNLTQRCREDGTFELDVPPGEYTVVVTAKGFAQQKRKAKVELRGVAILIVELEPGR